MRKSIAWSSEAWKCYLFLEITTSISMHKALRSENYFRQWFLNIMACELLFQVIHMEFCKAIFMKGMMKKTILILKMLILEDIIAFNKVNYI